MRFAISLWYHCCGVATISGLLKIIGLFCKRALQKRLYSAKETYNFKEPTNRSHAMCHCTLQRYHPDIAYLTWKARGKRGGATTGARQRSLYKCTPGAHHARRCHLKKKDDLEIPGKMMWCQRGNSRHLKMDSLGTECRTLFCPPPGLSHVPLLYHF